jgi:hypothetical protein
MRNETSFVRSLMGALERDSFQHNDIASKWLGSKVDERASTAVRTSFYINDINMLSDRQY